MFVITMRLLQSVLCSWFVPDTMIYSTSKFHCLVGLVQLLFCQLGHLQILPERDRGLHGSVDFCTLAGMVMTAFAFLLWHADRH
jgi:hypothetical protein